MFRSNLFSEIYDFKDSQLGKILRIWHYIPDVFGNIYGKMFIIYVQLIHDKSIVNIVFLLRIRFQYHAANSTGLVATALQVTIVRPTIMIDDREKWSNNVVIVSCLYQLLALIA